MSMSRKSSRSSTIDTPSKDFFFECKAAYLSVLDSVDDRIESEDTLLEVLQQTGRNPTSKTLKKYWKEDTEELCYDDFVNICKSEAVTSEDDLMKAFKKIDINGDNYISLEELRKILNSKGEKKTREEVRKIIAEVDENDDGKLDYKEFCKMMMNTTQESKKLQRKMMERKEKKKRKENEQRKGDVSGSQLSVRSTASSIKIGTPSGSRKSSLLSIGEGSPPIPAQRKSLLHTASYLEQDDLPKPSPRVKKDKVRPGPATKSMKLDEPKNLREWNHIKTKGSFFIEDSSLYCHQYELNVPDDTKVWITIQPTKNKERGYDGNPIDTSVFIIRKRPDEDGNLLVAFSEHRDARGKYGVSCELTAGKYSIIPYTTGCRFKEREREPTSKPVKIITQKEGKYVITKAFRDILREMFDNSDLDGNGYLSRNEFNLYNLRTSNEEVTDDEWGVVEDQITLEDGEIPFEGFYKLNELEVEDCNGDFDDIWTTLSSMGYNTQLVMDHACPFKLDVYIEDCDDAELDVVTVDSYLSDKLDFEETICRGFIEHGELSRIKGMKDLCLYTYINDGWASLVLDNKSHTKVRVELDCKRSDNVITNANSLQQTIRVDPGAAIIACHFTPEDDSRDWQVKCTETIKYGEVMKP